MENRLEAMRNKAITSLWVLQCLMEGMKREIDDDSVEYDRFEAAGTNAMKARELLRVDNKEVV